MVDTISNSDKIITEDDEFKIRQRMNRRDFVKYIIGTVVMALLGLSSQTKSTTSVLDTINQSAIKQKKGVVEALGTVNNYFIYSSNNASGTGNGGDSIIYIALIPWKRWRVVDCGFRVAMSCKSTIPEKVNIGIGISDIGESDDDYFGSWTQDTTADKQWVNGDMIVRMGSIAQKVDPPANGGIATFAPGNPDGLNIWQRKQALLSITKKNVAGGTGNIIGWVLVEVRNDIR